MADTGGPVIGRIDTLEAAVSSSRMRGGTNVSRMKAVSWWTTLGLAYESLGVIYGDVGTSPLYTYATTFPSGIKEQKDIIGALSLIMWTLTLSPLVKYIVFVLSCDDNGEGGTFALYSLLCRNVHLSDLRGAQTEDERALSFFTLEEPKKSSKFSSWVKNVLESQKWLQQIILFLVLLATCMVIGDGVLTPAQSVLSAIGGIKVDQPSLSQKVVIGVSCAVLAILFISQALGTHKIAFTFAPVVFTWFLAIGFIGIYNLFHFNGWHVFKALSPHYGISFLVRNGRSGWIALGGVFLCITGTEAMFADIGHFSPRAVRLAFAFFVYPCLSLAYIGQAAFLTRHPEMVAVTFYKSIPHAIYWPVFVVATAASAIASQAMITATFSIVNQSMSLGCFPPVKVIHTSKTIKGQIYIPEINFILMVLTLLVTAIMGKDGTLTIANAYGIAVSGVMIVTTVLVTLVLITVKKRPVWIWLPFFCFFFFFESVFVSSNLYKVPHGGWVSLTFAIGFLTVMAVWRYGAVKKRQSVLENKLSLDWVLTATSGTKTVKIPGVGLFYSELATGIPPIFSHFLASVPAVHEIIIFVAVKYIEVPSVSDDERFLFRRLGALKNRMFRCVVRYGYTDLRETKDGEDGLADQLCQALALYIRTEDPAHWVGNSGTASKSSSAGSSPNLDGEEILAAQDRSAEHTRAVKEREVASLTAAQTAGITHILGRSYLTARPSSTWYRKILINYAYWFIKANTRDGTQILRVPRESLLEVAMCSEI